MKKNHSRHSEGFTLVEMLITISILTLIFGIIFSTMKAVKSQASSVVCAGKLRDIGVALNSWTGDHGLKFPELAAARESRNDDVPVMDTVLREYLPDELAFQCPSDHQQIFEKTGSSYFWNSLINGQMIGNMDLLGITSIETGIPIASDKENFHKSVGDEVNILYADGHVDKQLQFIVDP